MTGRSAAALAVEGDPLKHIGALKQVRFVIRDRQVILDTRSPEGKVPTGPR